MAKSFLSKILTFLALPGRNARFGRVRREKRLNVLLRAQPFLKALQAVFERYF